MKDLKMTMKALPVLLLLLVGAAVVSARPQPQDSLTNDIVAKTMAQEDGESLVASLILAVARDWELGYEDATEFVRAVPAVTMNGTTFGPTTHPIDQPGRISFTASRDEKPTR